MIGRAAFFLLHPEGLAVRALVHGRILLMGTNLNLVQRAIVGRCTVVGALGNGARNALVRMIAAVHHLNLLYQFPF